ncbi:hypothetical protein P7C70_g5397, partial [Phenoliferia sp. Uapishka_3]
MGLSQESVAKLIRQGTTSLELEEVLGAYAFSKRTNGASSTQILRKLHLLTLYLRAIDMGEVVRVHYAAFAMAAFIAKTSGPNGPAVSPPRTALGVSALNAAMRPRRSLFKTRRAGSRTLGSVLYGASGSDESGGSSDADVEAGSTTGELERRRAGAGLGGWGLLSCPPSYVSSFPNRAPGWELDQLPEYS